jgi:hypothetical protein
MNEPSPAERRIQDVNHLLALEKGSAEYNQLFLELLETYKLNTQELTKLLGYTSPKMTNSGKVVIATVPPPPPPRSWSFSRSAKVAPGPGGKRKKTRKKRKTKSLLFNGLKVRQK